MLAFMASQPAGPERGKTLREQFDELTWAEIEADGIITLDEIDAELRAKGLDPGEYDYLYD